MSGEHPKPDDRTDPAQPDDRMSLAEHLTLGRALPREIARVRDQVIPAYRAIGQPGVFALAFMLKDVAAGERAMVEGDVVAMMRAYEALKGYHT